MDSRISALISKALDGLTLRSMASAQNIANANSPNYRPLRVSFEAELQQAALRGGDEIKAVDIRMAREEPLNGTGGQRIDLELATASETALRYSALIDVLGREIQLQRTLVRGGQ